MTPLNKRVKRMTNATVRDRGHAKRLVVTLYPSGLIGLRPESTRREETVTMEAVYGLAIKQRVAIERKEKLAKKNSKSKRRN